MNMGKSGIISKRRGNVPKVFSKAWLNCSNLHPTGTLRDGALPPQIIEKSP